MHLDRDYTASIDSHTSSEPGNPHLGPRTDTLLSLGLDYTASSFDGQGSLDLGPTNLYPFDFDFADAGSCNPSIVSNGFLPQINDFSSGYTSSLSFPDAFDDLSDLLPKPPTHSLWPQESPGDGPQEQVTSPEFSASISLISPFSPQNSPEIPVQVSATSDKFSCLDGDLGDASLDSSRQRCAIPRAVAPFKCQHCPARFVERRQMDNHKRNAHKLYRCSVQDCSAAYPHRKTLWEHRKRVHDGVRHQCDQCSYSCSKKSNLTRHKKIKHGVGG